MNDEPCQMCGYLVQGRVPLHYKNERPNSVRLVCERCAERHLASGQAETPEARAMRGTIVRETPPGRFQWRLIQRDDRALPDIWRRFEGGKWEMLIAAASKADIRRFW